MREALASVGIPVLRTELFTRVAYQEAVNVGQGVAQYAPRDPAATEVRALFDEIVGGEHPNGKAKRRKPTQATAPAASS